VPEKALLTYDDLYQGEPLRLATGDASIPADIVESHEQLFRFRGSLPDLGLADGDLLILDPRNSAATGEIVLVASRKCFYVGRWWAKHGRKELRDPEIRGNLRIVGVVNLILRGTK